MLVQTLTIVGVGLIGGSVGLAAKSRGLVRRVIGFGRDPANLAKARALGAIDEGVLTLADAVRDADLTIFCTPVDRIAEQVLAASAFCKVGAILTDAGSTKQVIVRDIETRLRADVHFVGGHPLAGSEKKGAEHAQKDLFVNRVTVLTRTAATADAALDTVAAFWRALGSRVEILSPERHDAALALTSHLPHVVASALAGLLPAEWRDFTATGFRDTTRIAGGDAEVWTPILQHNRPALLTALAQLDDRLTAFRQAIAKGDSVQIDQLLTQGKKVRDALGS
jgi:cyclohexadieny/prephenate dehydrogenase